METTNENQQVVLAVIGGSDKVVGDSGHVDHTVKKYAWGLPSHPLTVKPYGTNDRLKTVALTRHGLNHELAPHHVPYRSNIGALKQEGVTHILAFSAVGGLDPSIPVGTIVMVDQYVDLTSNMYRKKTFFEEGIVVHHNLAQPTCQRFADFIEKAAQNANVPIRRGGTLVCIEGPHFSTKAELAFYRDVLKGSVIGMTTAVEAKLAREAGIHYCNLAVVSDAADDTEVVSHQAVCNSIARTKANSTQLQEMVQNMIDRGESLVMNDPCSAPLGDYTATAPQARNSYISQNEDKFRIFAW